MFLKISAQIYFWVSKNGQISILNGRQILFISSIDPPTHKISVVLHILARFCLYLLFSVVSKCGFCHHIRSNFMTILGIENWNSRSCGKRGKITQDRLFIWTIIFWKIIFSSRVPHYPCLWTFVFIPYQSHKSFDMESVCW